MDIFERKDILLMSISIKSTDFIEVQKRNKSICKKVKSFSIVYRDKMLLKQLKTKSVDKSRKVLRANILRRKNNVMR